MTACPVCASNRTRRLYDRTTIRTYAVRRCAECGSGFVTPRPDEAELAAFYTETYFERPADMHPSLGYADYTGDSWAAANAVKAWTDVREWSSELAARSPGALLDVGCATGDFAAAARDDGWAVQGMELSAAARERAAFRHGLEVVGDLSDPALPAAGFDLVTMFHVLEHVIDPAVPLRQVLRLTAPGGLLLVEVPNWGSLGRRVRRADWSQLRPPEHLTFLTVSSLPGLLARTGWRTIRADTPYPKPADLAAEARRQGRPARAAVLSGAAAVTQRLGVGGYLRVLATPA